MWVLKKKKLTIFVFEWLMMISMMKALNKTKFNTYIARFEICALNLMRKSKTRSNNISRESYLRLLEIMHIEAKDDRKAGDKTQSYGPKTTAKFVTKNTTLWILLDCTSKETCARRLGLLVKHRMSYESSSANFMPSFEQLLFLGRISLR